MLACHSSVSVVRLGAATAWAPLLRAQLFTTRRGGIGSSSIAAGGQFVQTSTTTSEKAQQEAAVVVDKMKGDVSGPMLEPSVANTSWARSLVTLAAVGAAAGATGYLPHKAAAFVHLAAFGTWFGAIIFQTFIVGLTLFKIVPRQTFGKIMSHLFPKYFLLTTAANAIMLGTLLLGSKTIPLASQAPMVLGVALVSSLINWLAVEPVTTRLMFERYDLENSSERTDAVKARIQALYKQFGKYHGLSSVINLVVLACAFSHAWYLGSMLA